MFIVWGQLLGQCIYKYRTMATAGPGARVTRYTLFYLTYIPARGPGRDGERGFSKYFYVTF